MMSSRHRYRVKLHQRFPWFLSRWLAKLPSDGFIGERSRRFWKARKYPHDVA